MDFNDMSSLFGGSIFAEEYRGDFKQIEAEIQRIERAHPPHTLQALARRCLLRGIFEMLRGEYGPSQAYFDEIRQHEANLDDKWKARLRLYERLNLVFRLTPPLIRFRSNLGGSASTIRDCELEAQSKLAAPIPLYPMTSIVEICEFQVLQQLHSAYIATWVSASLYPQFAHAGLKGAAEAQKALLYDAPPAQMLNNLAISGLGATHAYFTRLKCEINPGNIQVEPTVAFADVQNMYLKTNDHVGMACHRILLGDRIVSPPFTSPVALNLILEGQLLGWENEEWDKIEPSFCLTQNEDADSHYSTALGHVHGIAAPRVRGAISLRRACILHITAIQSLSNREEAEALFSDAAVNLYSAEDDFSLDESHLQIISCHKLLLDISRGDHLLLEDRAAEIGTWGKSSENTALAQFLGIMMMRFGRRLFLDQARVDLAQLCLNCAKACFQALGDEIYILQSNLADTQLKHGSGNFVAAQVVIDTVRKETQALNYLRDLSSRSVDNADVLGLPIANLFTGYNRIVSNVYSSANDANAIQSWREEYRKLKSELKIARTLAGRPPSQSVQADFAAPLSDASGRPIDAEELLDETEAASDLMDIYNDYMTQGYAALDQADVESFNRCIERYLAESTRIRGAEDIRLTHHVIAYTALCNYEKARELVPQAIESTFGGCAKSLVASELRSIRFNGLSISNEVKIDFNAAERAISLCYISHDWKRGRAVLAEVERAFPELLRPDGPNFDRTQWKFGVYVACIWEHNDDTDKAFSWYRWSLQSLQTQRTHVEDPDARRGMGWSIHNANLFAGLIRMSLQFWRLRNSEPGQKSPLDWGLAAPDWLAQAFVFMEDSFARTLLELIIAHDETSIDDLESWSSRSFLIRQINDLKSLETMQRKLVKSVEDEISSLKPSDRNRRNELSKKLQIRSRDLKSLGKNIEQYEESLKELEQLVGVQELSRSLSKASKALLSATQFRIDTSTIFTAIAPDTAVIELNTSRGGLIVLGITRKGVEVAHQDPINELELRKLLFPYIKALRDKGVGIKDASLVMKLTTVSEMILEPLHELLEQVEHVIFVPSSTFMSFPFGCLLYNKEPLILRKAVSQVPSLAILERLVKLDEKRQGRHPGKPKLFTIVNSHQKTNSEVPTVVFGALSLYRLFGTPPLAAEALDEARFATEYRDATFVHVGTHGHQSALSPWQSYLSLAKQFKVMELAKLKTNALLVVFCACLSGLGRVTNGNDVLGFSHAVLQSGAQVYMGALWKVSEFETVMLMILFYSKLAAQEEGVSIAKAWQHAQVSLHNMNKEKALQLLKEAMADWDHAEENRINPDSFVNNGKAWLDHQIEKMDWDEEHFKNPYYWASFSLVGNAGLSLQWSLD